MASILCLMHLKIEGKNGTQEQMVNFDSTKEKEPNMCFIQFCLNVKCYQSNVALKYRKRRNKK
jgi:hypothetical protein